MTTTTRLTPLEAAVTECCEAFCEMEWEVPEEGWDKLWTKVKDLEAALVKAANLLPENPW